MVEKTIPQATDAVNRLVQELSRLPGIGPKSAQRLTYYLLRAPAEQTRTLSEALTALKASTRLCPNCCNITDADLCPICSARRKADTVMVVEQPQDILAIEHAGIYKGCYHVLHGAISPTEGVGSENIRVKELVNRLKPGDIKEVIIGTNPNVEGETTAMYLKRLLAPLGVKITRLARGLPFGTELEYADDVTLSRAVEGRQEF
jgi:recombination protein RecR